MKSIMTIMMILFMKQPSVHMTRDPETWKARLTVSRTRRLNVVLHSGLCSVSIKQNPCKVMLTVPDKFET